MLQHLFFFVLKYLFLYFTAFALMSRRVCFHVSRHFLLCLAALVFMSGSICLRISQQLLACLATLAFLCLVVVFAMLQDFTPCINDNVSAVSVWKEKVIEAPLNLKVTNHLNKCNLLNFDWFYN